MTSYIFSQRFTQPFWLSTGLNDEFIHKRLSFSGYFFTAPILEKKKSSRHYNTYGYINVSSHFVNTWPHLLRPSANCDVSVWRTGTHRVNIYVEHVGCSCALWVLIYNGWSWAVPVHRDLQSLSELWPWNCRLPPLYYSARICFRPSARMASGGNCLFSPATLPVQFQLGFVYLSVTPRVTLHDCICVRKYQVCAWNWWWASSLCVCVSCCSYWPLLCNNSPKKSSVAELCPTNLFSSETARYRGYNQNMILRTAWGWHWKPRWCLLLFTLGLLLMLQTSPSTPVEWDLGVLPFSGLGPQTLTP